MIGVTTELHAKLPGLRELLKHLSDLVQVDFREIPSLAGAGELAGVLALAGDAARSDSGPPTFRFWLVNGNYEEDVLSFSDSLLVPSLYRGRSLQGCRLPIEVIPSTHRSIALASSSRGPIWISLETAGNRHDTHAISLAEWFKPGDAAFQHLGGANVMGLLPLIHWLHCLPASQRLKPAPLRACIQFDDPNLHRPTYGFIDYRAMAQHAKAHRYHAAMATVPLDNYFANQRAAALFRENRDYLSLLIHGNNHTSRELAQPYSDQQRAHLVSQSLQRIQQVEARSELPVCRVMAAPHGACAEAMLQAMAIGGYEAATISSGSLANHNRGKQWTRALGLAPVEMVAGLPVMNRFRLRRGCEANILLAAYLGQPIIPVGHHWDLADGLDLLEEVAGFINSLGAVAWMPMSGISRSNYQTRSNSTRLEVELFSRRAEISIPPGTESLRIHAPWISPDRDLPLAEAAGTRLEPSGSSLDFEVRGIGSITFRVMPRTASANGNGSEKGRTPWLALGRRILAESRDRAMPYLPRRFVKR